MMINIKEIRPGNILFYKDDFVQVEEIKEVTASPSQYRILCKGLKPEGTDFIPNELAFEPVPLNTEVLDRFGFTNIHDIRIKEIHYGNDIHKLVRYLHNEWTIDEERIEPQPENLHQLQNFIADKTGFQCILIKDADQA